MVKTIGDLQTQLKTAVDTEKWMSHGVDLGYTKPDDVRHAYQAVLNLEEEIKRLQQTLTTLSTSKRRKDIPFGEGKKGFRYGRFLFCNLTTGVFKSR
ncbi:hypothetical protein CDAR_578971 [Caerostris darwini]|uniref:Uncharacterized protein n=1 Tax=Caerostris darwini TaxID=1538125 RepID=A0AAV4RTS4_9ARAC|nr:hypothetical protein CDAR_578971 [Caerostris darwini]